MMKYKIVEVHPQQHSIVVRFYSDDVTEASLADQFGEFGEVLRGRTDFNIDLPFPAPKGEALKQLIIAASPAQWLQNQALILDPNIDTSLSDILPGVGVEQVVDWPQPDPIIFDMSAAPL